MTLLKDFQHGFPSPTRCLDQQFLKNVTVTLEGIPLTEILIKMGQWLYAVIAFLSLESYFFLSALNHFSDNHLNGSHTLNTIVFALIDKISTDN